MRAQRPDHAQFTSLLEQQQFRSLWHFTRLVSVPCILFHRSIYSIEELEARGLTVPPRESREDDINKGVGDYVKLSPMPYWDMLSRLLRSGEPHVFVEFSTAPVLFSDTRFVDRNVWENGWQIGDTLQFARESVFHRKPKKDWPAGSPSEVYVRTELPIARARRILTYTKEDFDLLDRCLERLRLPGRDMLVIHGPKRPFPDQCHGAHLERRGAHTTGIAAYFDGVTPESLARGVEI